MKILRSALMVSAFIALSGAPAFAEIDWTKMPGFIFGGMMGGTTTNLRTDEHMAQDANQHPIMMMVVFGELKPTNTLVEVLPTDTYWSEYVGGLMTTSRRGHFIGAADQSDQALWKALSDANAFQTAEYSEHNELVPISYDSLTAPGTADMVLLSRKMGQLMAAGNLEKLLASANKALKPGGTLLVEDYRAKNDKPQDPKAASGYIRQDYAIATITKAGFKLVNTDDKLLANPNDTRAKPAPNSDRFLLRFSKP